MKRRRQLALSVAAALVASISTYAGWARFRSPELAAQGYPIQVWVALEKGSEGTVHYVGSDNTYAYFRVGIVFSSYYKAPACTFLLPETFSVHDGRSYVVRLRLQTDDAILRGASRCSDKDGPFLGELERT